MKKLSILVLAFIMVFAMAACGGNNGSTNNSGTSDQTQNSAASDNSKTASGGDIVVTLDIDYPDSSEAVDVDDVKVTVPKNSTALDVLKKYADENNIKIVIDESDNTSYVSSIGGVAATDTAGWIYEINDKTFTDTADKQNVTNGDDVEWSYERMNENDY